MSPKDVEKPLCSDAMPGDTGGHTGQLKKRMGTEETHRNWQEGKAGGRQRASGRALPHVEGLLTLESDSTTSWPFVGLLVCFPFYFQKTSFIPVA